MEQQTPIPAKIKDEAARRAKTHHFPTFDLGSWGEWGEGGGGENVGRALGFPFILSKILVERALYPGGYNRMYQEP